MTVESMQFRDIYDFYGDHYVDFELWAYFTLDVAPVPRADVAHDPRSAHRPRRPIWPPAAKSSHRVRVPFQRTFTARATCTACRRRSRRIM